MCSSYLLSHVVPFIRLYADPFPFPFLGGSDYKGERFTVTFPAGVNVISFNVAIIDDNIAELAEFFTLYLEIPDAAAILGVIKGSPSTATISIMSDEGEAIK